MNRRTFLAGTGAVLLALPLAAEAQQTGKVYRVGFLTGSPVPQFFEALRQGLHERGWIEGQNLAIEYRSAESRYDRVPELAAELVGRKVDVLFITATAMPYFRQAAVDLPIVFTMADDPVSKGYVASLARPGGRMTGVTSLNVGLEAKRLEILKTMLPGVRSVGVLSSPRDGSHRERLETIERAARSLGLQARILEVPTADTLSDTFDAAHHARVGALMVMASPILIPLQGRIADLATKARLPVISAWREFPEGGGLLSYGTNVASMYRRAASYVDRILKGANPADLPVEQATTFEFVINLKTAKALGLTIPPSLLGWADEIIQ
jgi:putative tryptophan/tyrosine transport system substrate-binding protein